MRNLERAAVDRARIARDAARDDAEAIGAVLLAAIEQDLDTDADAEERFAGAGDVVAKNFDESERAQIFHRGAGRSDPRQYHAIGGDDTLGAIGYLGFMAEELERALNAGQVAGFVIDDCDHGSARRSDHSWSRIATQGGRVGRPKCDSRARKIANQISARMSCWSESTRTFT